MHVTSLQFLWEIAVHTVVRKLVRCIIIANAFADTVCKPAVQNLSAEVSALYICHDSCYISHTISQETVHACLRMSDCLLVMHLLRVDVLRISCNVMLIFSCLDSHS